MMRWQKLGRVFSAEKQHDWMYSHAANPFAENRGGDLFRIYFSCRDARKRSSVGWVEIRLSDPTKVLAISPQPVLSAGPTGEFDDSGITVGNIVARGKDRLFYYLGWNLSTPPWRNTIGLATAPTTAEQFQRASSQPVLGCQENDPYTLSYPWVLPQDDGFAMWYGSNLIQGDGGTAMQHVIKYASSRDGREWQHTGEIAIPLEPGEYGLSRPCVLRAKDKYQMWYSIRRDHYRLGYAESTDGRHWQRLDDQMDLPPSPEGWDSEDLCYPTVFDFDGKRYLLYCGNKYGMTGFGLAVLIA